MSSFSALQQYSNKQYTQKKIFSQTHTQKNQLLPKSLLYVGSVYVFLRACVCVYVCGLRCASRMPRDELAA